MLCVTSSSVSRNTAPAAPATPSPNIGLSYTKKDRIEFNRRVQSVNACDASTSSIATALRSRGSPVGRRSLSLMRVAAAARSTVDCQCAIGRFSLFS